MFHQFRAAPVLLLPAVFLLCCFPAIGQTNSDRDRTLSINTNSARRDRSRSGSGAVQAKVNTKLPFEESVIIYYNGPPKRSESSNPAVSSPRGDVTVSGVQDPKKQPTDNVKFLAKRTATPSRMATQTYSTVDLQPVIIYYGANRPLVAVNRTEQVPLDSSVRLAKTTSFIKKEPAADISTRSVPKRSSQFVTRSNTVTAQKDEITDLTFERPVGKPIAPSDVAVSSMMPTTATTTEEATSGSPSASETGSVDAVELNNSAVHLTLEHKFAEAQALLERAIQAEPTSAKFHRNLSVLFERMKKLDEALASARTAEKLAPNDPTVLDQLCLLELVAGNNAAVAVGCFEKLKSIEPLDDMSQAHYGLALFRTGKEKESIAILEQVARSTPANAEAMHVLGVVYYQSKRFDDAAEALKTAVEIAPDQLEIRFNLAVVQLARRNRAAAISQYNIIKAGDANLADRLYRMLNSDNVLSVSDLKRPNR